MSCLVKVSIVKSVHQGLAHQYIRIKEDVTVLFREGHQTIALSEMVGYLSDPFKEHFLYLLVAFIQVALLQNVSDNEVTQRLVIDIG
jgi:hypothetical protein